jgi:hypothetical protein
MMGVAVAMVVVVVVPTLAQEVERVATVLSQAAVL